VYALFVSTHYRSNVTADEGGPVYYQQQILSTVQGLPLSLGSDASDTTAVVPAAPSCLSVAAECCMRVEPGVVKRFGIEAHHEHRRDRVSSSDQAW
jgi:hypothetical protein